MIKISIIVPIYRVESYLHRCVDSILAQTYRDFELILVDDGSPDNCGRICDEYAALDARIIVIHRENGGLSAARNSGIEWVLANSNSKWITFVDSDDWIHPSMLKTLHDAIVKTNADVSVCGYTRSSEWNQDESLAGSGEVLLKLPEEFWVWCHDECDTGMFTSNVAWGKLYSTALFSDIRYPEDVKAHEDVFTTYKVLFAARSIAVVQQQLYHYFVNTDSITGNRWTPARINVIYGEMHQIEYFENHGLFAALKAAVDWHFDRLEWNLMSAREGADFCDVADEVKSLIKQRYDKYCRLTNRRIRWYALACVAHPIRARVFYPYFRISDVLKRHGIRGIILKLFKI